MDTSLCDVDVQPTYVRVTLKGKVSEPAVLNAYISYFQPESRNSCHTGETNAIDLDSLAIISPQTQVCILKKIV